MTANKALKKGVPLTLGERDFTLKYTLDSFCELSEVTGKDVLQDSKFFDKPSVKELVGIIWAGIIHEFPEITTKEIGQLIDFQDITRVMEAIRQAVLIADAPAEPGSKPAKN